MGSQQEASAAAQQASNMFMPMFGGGFMQMQPMVFQPPAGCLTNALQTKCGSTVNFKVDNNINMTQSKLETQPSFVPTYQYGSAPSMQSNMNFSCGNLAHCA